MSFIQGKKGWLTLSAAALLFSLSVPTALLGSSVETGQTFSDELLADYSYRTGRYYPAGYSWGWGPYRGGHHWWGRHRGDGWWRSGYRDGWRGGYPRHRWGYRVW